jgi:hypothetical protein
MNKGTKTNRGTTPKQPKHNYEALGFGMRSAAVVQQNRMLVRRGIDAGFKQESAYQNPQHADRRARAEDGAYDRNAAKRVLGMELEGAYMITSEESL